MKNASLILSLLLNLLLIGGLWYLVQSLGGFSYMLFKMKNRGATGVYEMRKNVFEVMPKDTGAIVMVGNSLTAGCEWSELLGVPVKNRGIAGDLSSGLLDRLPAITALQASRLFLMIGINDLLFVSPAEVLENYEQILLQIQRESPHTEVFILSVLPVNNKVRQTGIQVEDILVLNTGIQELADRQLGTYVNLYRRLVDAEGNLDARFTYDGIHLTGEAYLIWKNEIEQYLGEGLE